MGGQRVDEPAAIRRGTALVALAGALALAPACSGGLVDTVLGREPEPETTSDTLLPPGDDEIVILSGQPLDDPSDLRAQGTAASATPGGASPDRNAAPGTSATTAAEAPAGGADPAEPAAAVETADPTASDDGDLLTVTNLLLALVALAVTGLVAGDVRRMLHAWRGVDARAAAPGFGPPEEPATSFSVLVPAVGPRADPDRLGPTLESLAALDHPFVEVLAVVGHDDAACRTAAGAIADRHPERVRVVVDRNFRKSPSLALATGLADSTGEVVAVFEPGDDVHHQLLRHVDTHITRTGAAGLQAGVRWVGARRWYAMHHALDRWTWFRSRLHRLAEQRFTPLAPTTAFVRADVLRDRGGWDTACPAAAPEVGIRLSVAADPVAVVDDAHLATHRWAPESLREAARDHVAWLAGFRQVARRGVWKQLPRRRQRLQARLTLAQPALAALAGLAVPLPLGAALLLGAPPVVALVAALPLVPAVIGLVVEALGQSERARERDRDLPLRDRATLVATAVPHRLLLGLAALRALATPRTDAAEAAGRRRRDADADADRDRGRPARPARPTRAPRLAPGHADVVDLDARRREPGPPAAPPAGRRARTRTVTSS
ncbi:MAG TPA: glycosyltransferase [Acidimicrobiales bacterium]|nr:glycosyltransferase [Acidimicrobiales bacterium]